MNKSFLRIYWGHVPFWRYSQAWGSSCFGAAWHVQLVAPSIRTVKNWKTIDWMRWKHHLCGHLAPIHVKFIADSILHIIYLVIYIIYNLPVYVHGIGSIKCSPSTSDWPRRLEVTKTLITAHSASKSIDPIDPFRHPTVAVPSWHNKTKLPRSIGALAQRIWPWQETLPPDWCLFLTISTLVKLHFAKSWFIDRSSRLHFLTKIVSL